MNLEVPSRGELESIFTKHHDRLDHPGINSTVNEIQQKYTWVGMYPDIANYVSENN